MAVSSKVKKTAKVPGSERRTVTEVTLDNSYPTGGEPVTAAELGLRTVDFAYCVVKNPSEAEATGVLSAWFDDVNMKIVVNDLKTQKEFAAAKDLSKVIVLVYAFGK